MPQKEPIDPKDTLFHGWLQEVDQLCRNKFGLSLKCLPDLNTRDAFDAGTTPRVFFENDVMDIAREEFGSLVDEL